MCVYVCVCVCVCVCVLVLGEDEVEGRGVLGMDRMAHVVLFFYYFVCLFFSSYSFVRCWMFFYV